MTRKERTTNLTVLDGGRSLPVSEMHRVLLHAYVTDTRLMGVLAVCAHWSIASQTADRNDPDSWEDLRQFFYIDCEEAGLETYQQVRGGDVREAKRIEEALVCGLGARKVELNERQLRLLLQHWYRFNEEHLLPAPAGWPQYSFLLSPVIDAGEEERSDLMQMICPQLRSDEQVVNYFLMRCFGSDPEGIRYLAAPDVPLDLYSDYTCATFCRNTIDDDGTYPDGATSYLCDSLVEMDGAYDKIVSRIVVKDLKVVRAQRLNRFPISDTEAAMILKKIEYITLYEVFLSEEEMEDNIDEFTLGFHATMSSYENGRLFMTFRPTNDHVDSRTFQLSNDVRGMYFLTNHGQLILCAHSLPDLHHLEQTISASVLAPYLIPSGRFNFVPGGAYNAAGTFEFREPILYEFMRSDFEHFEDFLAAMRGE